MNVTRDPERPDSAITSDFATVFARILRQLDVDQRMSTDAAHALRRAYAAADKSSTSSIGFEPEKHLGPFEELPPAARDAIVSAIVDRDRWDIRGHELGPWHPHLLRLLWRLRHRAWRQEPADARWAQTARELTDVLAYGARKAPAYVLGMLHRQWLAARGRLAARPTVHEAMNLAGINPRDFAVCYATGVPQADRYRGHWHDPSRQITVGRVIGIDFLPAPEGCWYIESNVSPQLDGPRVDLHEQDPVVCNLLDFAAQHGYRHLTVLDNTSSGIPPRMMQQFATDAKARCIELTLVELPNVPGQGRTRCYGLPPLSKDGTLVVRYRGYPSAIDYLFNTKRATFRALSMYRQQTGDPDLLLPLTGSEPLLADAAPDEPFPNVAYKLPEVEQGRGVYFFKAHSAEHVRTLLNDAIHAPRKRELQERVLHSVTDKQGVYQSYVRSRMLENRRLYKIRALVLISPVGIRCLSAYRVVSAHSVPERLDFGIVRDPRPFLVNAARGGYLDKCPEDEDRATARAAMAVGRGLAWAAEYGFPPTKPD